MTPAAYRAALRAARNPIAALALLLARRFRYRRMKKSDIAETVRLLYPHMVRARAEQEKAAGEFYATERGEPFDDIPPLKYDESATTKMVERVFAPVIEAGEAMTDDEYHQQIETTAENFAKASARHVDMAGRDTITLRTERDPRKPKWARALVNEGNCAFCIMLASRGPVYRSEKTAGPSEEWHDGCDCEAVPVFDAANWPGREEYLAAKELWEETGSDINALRRHLYSL